MNSSGRKYGIVGTLVAWSIVLGFLVLGLIAYFTQPMGLTLRKPTPTVPPPTLFDLPPPLPIPGTPQTFRLPDHFPEAVGNFALHSTKEENLPAGATSYFVARYASASDETVSVRVVGLKKATAKKFVEVTTGSLTASAEVVDDGGNTPGILFSKDGAGIYLLSDTEMVLIVSASSPGAARDFGLELIPHISHSRTKSR